MQEKMTTFSRCACLMTDVYPFYESNRFTSIQERAYEWLRTCLTGMSKSPDFATPLTGRSADAVTPQRKFPLLNKSLTTHKL